MSEAPTPAHRRIWRLAFLLTGSADGAASLINRIQRVQKSPESLEPALLDRLIIQNARSIPRADIVALPPVPRSQVAAPASAALSAALKLPHQPLEAWVLRRLDDLDDLHIARAMDCSKTAARQHLAAADESMATRLGEARTHAVHSLRAYVDALDPLPFILSHREASRVSKHKRLRKIALVSAGIILLAMFIGLRIHLGR